MIQLWQKHAIGRSINRSLPSDGICRSTVVAPVARIAV